MWVIPEHRRWAAGLLDRNSIVSATLQVIAIRLEQKGRLKAHAVSLWKQILSQEPSGMFQRGLHNAPFPSQ